MHDQEFFYTVKPTMKDVTKEEYVAFIKNYPRKLEADCCAISDPPLITHNDFELANRWPYSIVAEHYAYSDDPNDYYYTKPEDQHYYIMENFEEVFNSKTGNMAGYGE